MLLGHVTLVKICCAKYILLALALHASCERERLTTHQNLKDQKIFYEI